MKSRRFIRLPRRRRLAGSAALWNGDTFILQYRDYPHLPKFVRHRSAIALMSPSADEAKPAAQSQQA
jgi:hypothetical protein